MVTHFAQSQFLYNLDILKGLQRRKIRWLLAGIVLKTDGLVSKKEDEIDVLPVSIPQGQGYFAIGHRE